MKGVSVLEKNRANLCFESSMVVPVGLPPGALVFEDDGLMTGGGRVLSRLGEMHDDDDDASHVLDPIVV